MKDYKRLTEDYVFIHDGARPYVNKESIDDLVECLKDIFMQDY